MEKKIKLKLPSLPNFLQDENGNTFSVRELTDAEIKKLGKEWTEALIKRNKLAKKVNFN